ncbi:MAG: LEPR-XLL domain-containing protein, partial [Gammaproteobacteria bacterium]
MDGSRPRRRSKGKGRSRSGWIFDRLQALRRWSPPAPVDARPERHRLQFEALEPRVLLAADPFVVATVSGSLDLAGETDQYTFTLDEPARIVFDSLTNRVDLAWSLTGPDGAAVAVRSFSASDSAEAPESPVLELAAGQYSLTVDGTADATGDYSFRLLDLAKAAELPEGVAQAETLEAGNETRVYRFDANAGDRFFIDVTSREGGDLQWRLLDPFDQQVFGPAYMNASSDDRELAPLPFTGTYTLLIEGRVSRPEPASYGFTLHRIEDASLPLVVGATTAAEIASPGQRHVYSFTLATDARLLFDSLTYSYNFRWTLTGPRGAIVTDRTFNGSDSADLGSSFNPLLELPAGEYTLTVDAAADVTGSYGFRLLDLQAATPLALGETVSTSLPTGRETLIYRISAAGRERALFDLISESRDTVSWRLLDPYGRTVFGPSNTADVLCTLSYTGSYVLLIEGRVSETNPVDFSFRVLDTAPANPSGYTSQDFDDPGLPWVGRAHDGAPVPAVTAGGPTGSFLRLLSGDASGINTVGFTATHPGVLPATATLQFDFRITGVNLSGDGMGVAWLDTAIWGNGGEAPSFHEEVNVTGSFGIGLDVYNNGEVSDNHLSLHFDGVRLADFDLNVLIPGFQLDNGLFNHARIVLQAVEGGTTVSVYLTPNGGAETQVVADYLVGGMAPYAGRLAFAGRNGWARGHQDLDNVSVAVTTGTLPEVPALALNTTVSGTLATSTERDSYAFTLTETKRLYFDSLTSQGNLNWTLTGPQGPVVSSRWFDYSDSADGLSLLDLPPGDYVLRVTGAATAYSFRLLELASATVYAPGTPEFRTLTPANSTDLFRFDAEAGQRFFFDVTARVGGDVYWRLLDPFGRVVFGPGNINNVWQDVDVTTLAMTGTYTLLVEGRRSNTGTVSYGFNVWPVSDDTTELVLDTQTSGSISQPGQRDLYTFTLAEDRRLYFDSLSGYDRPLWTLVGPRGTVVASQSFAYGEPVGAGTNPLLDLPAGDYTLIVDTAGDATGDYSFALRDPVSSAIALTPGTPIERTLTPANSLDFLSFEVTAGQRFFFDVTARDGGSVQWRLLDPQGRTVFGPWNINNVWDQVETTTLTQTGTYTLLVMGSSYNTGTVSYGLNVQPVNDRTVAIVPGESSGNEPQWVSGRCDGGIRLNGQQYFELPQSASLDLTRALTLEAWVQVERFDSTWTPLFFKGSGIGNDGSGRSWTVWLHSNGMIGIGSSDGGQQWLQTA